MIGSYDSFGLYALLNCTQEEPRRLKKGSHIVDQHGKCLVSEQA